ncbi:glycosyltransferase family 4 protein [Thermoproteota archaeon]
MKIGIVAFSGIFPIHIGGPASVGYFIAKWLGEFGNEITLFVRVKTKRELEFVGRLEEFTKLKNVKVIPIMIDYRCQTFLNPLNVIFQIYTATKAFSSEKFDVVHYNSPPIDIALLFPFFAKLKQTRQTLAIHTGIYTEINNPVGRSILNLEKDLFNQVIVFNEFSQKVAKTAGFSEDSITTIPNGVDIAEINKAQPLKLLGEPKVLYVGRLSKIKNVEVLIRAFAEILKEFPKAILYLVGDGSSRDSLEKITNRLKIRNNVVFKGTIPNTTVFRYYKSVDVLVLPSFKENFSIVLLEAMASKVPIVASDAEGNKHIIKDNSNGLIFCNNSWKDLSRQLIRVLSDRNLHKKLANNSYHIATTGYNWKQIALQYQSLFHSLRKITGSLA